MVILRPCRKRKAIGLSLIGVGVVGLILPVLNGSLPLALGLFMLRHQYVWAQRALAPLARRWPEALARAEGMEERALAWFGRQASRLSFSRARSR
ncbi:MAG: PGPGW domain-containing protein [Rhodovarius sp.]|nr:hypothetical protein [Rhodovarius sp.]MCX7931394.1 hypothetical protein [Rhodovarius sp.]MDW8315485.1 PGPGW domain-containing protein [Rhodovarius sp.]